MSLLNITCTYAIRAALYVASSPAGASGYVSTRKIADDLGVSFAFLTKVLQGLTRRGVLKSQRGAAGGVALARPADNITLLDLVAGAGRDGLFHECVLGLTSCSETEPCALHHEWRAQRGRLEALFASTTLAALASDPQAIAGTMTRARKPRRKPAAEGGR